jgi:membrane protein required for colicin V production
VRFNSEVCVNIIDIVFILGFFGMIALGFFQGMIRLLVLLLAFYLSLVLASLYYPAMGEFFVRQFSTQRFVGQYIGFGMVLFFSFIALSAAGVYTFRYAQLPGQLQYLDRIVGTFLGMVLGVFLLGILATLLWNLLIVRGGRNIDMPVMGMLGGWVATSQVLLYFSRFLLPQLYMILDPVLPDGAALIFAIQ